MLDLVVLGLLALPLAGQSPPHATPAQAVRSIDELRAQLEAHLGQPRFSPALWGVKVVSLDTGRTWFEHHADRRLSPGSNCKLFTAAVALDRLGSDYRIVTPLLGNARPDRDGTLAGNLVVSGRGDPSWNPRREQKDFWVAFEPFVATLERAGVRRITGDLVADATFFRALPNGAGWTADDLNDYYGAEISAVSLNDNYAELRVTPGAREGEPGALALLQPHTGLVLDNRTVTIAATGTRRIDARRIFGERIVHVFGELPLGGKEEEPVDLTVPRPAAWFAAAFKEALNRRGIRVDGQARSLRWPDAPAAGPGAIVLGEVSSPPLRDMIAALMKPSQNLETDLIFAHLGEKYRAADAPPGRTSEQSAVLVLQDFLRQNGLPADEVIFEEGSGLSRNNLATANATVALLRFMAGHPAAADFTASLPVAGVDGTLRRRLKDTPAEGNLRAKTGTLRFANTLSGYLKTAGGERLAVSLMLNRNVQPAGRNVREELDDIVVLLARFGK